MKQDGLKELLSYDDTTGEFRWKVGGKGWKAGKIAGYKHQMDIFILA